ncbi:MAG: hypothetical protein R3E08_09110 [Thiotrichaceae bacterium]
MLETEERVNHLDELMARLIQTVEQTSKEMREFKQEMRQSHERSEQEMREAQTRDAATNKRCDNLISVLSRKCVSSTRDAQSQQEVRQSHKYLRWRCSNLTNVLHKRCSNLTNVLHDATIHEYLTPEMQQSHERFEQEMRQSKRDSIKSKELEQ